MNEPAKDGWKTMDSAPRDGTKFLALLRREACTDMDDVRQPEFTEIRQIWYAPCSQLGMTFSWAAGDPMGASHGMEAETYFGKDYPTRWRPLPKEE